MIKKASILAMAAALAGCASPVPSSSDLMKYPADKVTEVNYIASVPVPVAFRNVLENARRCWSAYDRLVESDPFDEQVGYARVSVRLPGTMVVDGMVLTTAYLSPESDQKTRIVARNLSSVLFSFKGKEDLPYLQQWAEGKSVPCG